MSSLTRWLGTASHLVGEVGNVPSFRGEETWLFESVLRVILPFV